MVEQSGELDKGEDKIASSKLSVKIELSLFDMIKAQIEFVKSHLSIDKESNTGYQSAASNTGDCSAASVEGKESVAIVTGFESKAKASEGSWIVVAERNDEGEIINIKSAKTGVDVKPDVFYKLISNEFIKVDE